MEDDPDFALATLDLLRSRGYEVISAASATEAVARQKAEPAQVALVDVRLQSEDGVELARTLRREDPQLVCVMITAHRSLDSVLGALREGAYDYLLKPVEPEKMLHVLERAFEKVFLQSRHENMVSALQTAHEELLTYRDRLRASSLEQHRREEHARRALAADLHDSLGQALATANFKLGLLARDLQPAGPAWTLAEESRNVIKAAIHQVRQMVFSIVPPLLYEMGLPAALERLGEEIEAKFALPCVIDCPAGLELDDEDLAVVAYRTLRELFINAGKHARATRLSVRVKRDADALVGSVHDDGIGFCVAEGTQSAPSGFGLFSVRDRLEQLGGSLRIRSSPGDGTLVEFTLPLTSP